MLSHFLLIFRDNYRLRVSRIGLTSCSEHHNLWTHQKYLQCYSPTVGHSMQCNEIALQRNLPCHLQTIGHATRCDETAIQNNVPHHSQAVGYKEDVMRLPFEKKYNSQTVGYRARHDGTTFQQNLWWHSLSVGHGTWCDDSGFQRNIAHFLFRR